MRIANNPIATYAMCEECRWKKVWWIPSWPLGVNFEVVTAGALMFAGGVPTFGDREMLGDFEGTAPVLLDSFSFPCTSN